MGKSRYSTFRHVLQYMVEVDTARQTGGPSDHRWVARKLIRGTDLGLGLGLGLGGGWFKSAIKSAITPHATVLK